MAIYSTQVIGGLLDYFNALLAYPISLNRAIEKFTNLVSSLNNLDHSIGGSICKWKDLGQRYDNKGNPIFPHLKQHIWKDEAKRPWTFSYFLYPNGIAHIQVMKYSAFIVDSIKERFCNLLENIS